MSDFKLGFVFVDDICYLVECIREVKLLVLLVGMWGLSEKEMLVIW